MKVLYLLNVLFGDIWSYHLITFAFPADSFSSQLFFVLVFCSDTHSFFSSAELFKSNLMTSVSALRQIVERLLTLKSLSICLSEQAAASKLPFSYLRSCDLPVCARSTPEVSLRQGNSTAMLCHTLTPSDRVGFCFLWSTKDCISLSAY